VSVPTVSVSRHGQVTGGENREACVAACWDFAAGRVRAEVLVHPWLRSRSALLGCVRAPTNNTTGLCRVTNEAPSGGSRQRANCARSAEPVCCAHIGYSTTRSAYPVR
jgi:hypothetical protein